MRRVLHRRGRRARRCHRCKKRGPESVDVSVQFRDLALELRGLQSVAAAAAACRYARILTLAHQELLCFEVVLPVEVFSNDRLKGEREHKQGGSLD